MKAMKTLTRFCVLSALLLLSTLSGWSQIHDVEAWIGNNAKFAINKRFDFSLGQQFRLNSMLSRFNQYLVEPQISFGRKGFDIGLAYRFSVRNEGSPYVSFRHRYQIAVGYRHRFGDFRLGTKVRFQQVLNPIRNAERLPNGSDKLTLRHKFDLKYEGQKKAQPFIAIEYFLPLDKGLVTVSTVRYRVGVDVDLPKKMEMTFFYTSEHVYGEEQPTYIHTLGVSHSIAPVIDKKKGKKKKKKKKD